MNLFDEECYWRDLVAFTWNVKTAEGKDDIQAMLAATFPQTKPSHWKLEDESTIDNGTIGGWFSFETAVARGKAMYV